MKKYLLIGAIIILSSSGFAMTENLDTKIREFDSIYKDCILNNHFLNYITLFSFLNLS